MVFDYIQGLTNLLLDQVIGFGSKTRFDMKIDDNTSNKRKAGHTNKSKIYMVDSLR